MKRYQIILSAIITLSVMFTLCACGYKIGVDNINQKNYEDCLRQAQGGADYCYCDEKFGKDKSPYCTNLDHEDALHIYTNENIYYVWVDDLYIGDENGSFNVKFRSFERLQEALTEITSQDVGISDYDANIIPGYVTVITGGEHMQFEFRNPYSDEVVLVPLTETDTVDNLNYHYERPN